MRLETDLRVTTQFTRVPNAVIADPSLTATELQLWVRLHSLLKGDTAIEAGVSTKLASLCDLEYRTFHRARKGLEAKGYLINDSNKVLTTTIPESANTPTLGTPEEPKEGFSIAEEESEKPRRSTGSLSQADRRALIKEAWNKHKLPNWEPIKGSTHLSSMIAVEAQTKAQDHNRDDYDGFIKRVCDGARVHEWWSLREGIKIHNIFGFGTPEDKKFNSVATLYRLGATKKAASAGFDHSDEAFLDWYHAQGQKQMTKVERIAVDKPVDAAIMDKDQPKDETIRIYKSMDGKRTFHWTFKSTHPKFYYLP